MHIQGKLTILHVACLSSLSSGPGRYVLSLAHAQHELGLQVGLVTRARHASLAINQSFALHFLSDWPPATLFPLPEPLGSPDLIPWLLQLAPRCPRMGGRAERYTVRYYASRKHD